MLGSLLKGKKQRIPATGFNALPQNIRTLDSDIINDIFSTNPFDIANFQQNPSNANLYKNPLNANQRLTGQVTNYDQFLSPQALYRTAMQFQNPFQEQVVRNINRDATGAASQTRGALQRLGALGSNRDFLGASDVEERRQGMLGQLLSNQFNNSLQSAYTTGQGRFNTEEIGRKERIALGDAENQISEFNKNVGNQISEFNKSAPLRRIQAMQGTLQNLMSVDRTGTAAATRRSGGLGGILGRFAAPAGFALGGPVGGALGGAFGGLAGGGGLGGALAGGFSGYSGGGFGGGGFGGLSQNLGRFSSGFGNGIGPVQPLFGR